MKRLLFLLISLSYYWNVWCFESIPSLSGIHQRKRNLLLVDQAIESKNYKQAVWLLENGSQIPSYIAGKSQSVILQELKSIYLKADISRLKIKKRSQHITNNFYFDHDQRLGEWAKDRLLRVRKNKKTH